MQLGILLKALKGLKLQIEDSILLAESKNDEDVDDKLAGLIDRCKECLSAIWLAVHGPPVENSDQSINSELDKISDQEQIDHDNLDGIEFDDIFADSFSKNEAQVQNSSVQEKNSSAPDKQSSLPAADQMDQEQTTAERCREAVTNDAEFFDESAFDDEDMAWIEQAEKSITESVLHVDEDESNDIHQPNDPSYLEVLKQYFGYSKFRPLQWKIINSVLNDKRDNCVIMATGYGKSLTFQFPSVYTMRTSIIISPLISLMEDQVQGLQASSIEACFLGSAQSETAKIKKDMFSGRYRLIYVTPEFATNAISDFKKLHEQVGIDLIAIDEAHCVSQWGHDFREAYRHLGILKQEFPKIPILALTATATGEVQKDICSSLQLHNPSMTCTGFDRPNLFLSVDQKTGDIATDMKNMMKSVGNKFTFDGPTIIYCPTKKITEDVANVLNSLGVQCLPYHAKLSFVSRRKAHHSFLNDEIQVVVATVAFGMGIDKRDVRKVVHYGAPKDIESYYQEIGRAGRDGMPSVCTALFSKSDFAISKFFIGKISNEKFQQHKLRMLHKMQQYLEATTCRRRILLSYFESGNLDEIGGTQNCCDHCSAKFSYLRHDTDISNMLEKPVDYKKEATDLFKVIQATGNRFGLTVPVLVLTGSSSQKAKMFKANKVFGSGKYKSAKFWTALGKALIYEEYLQENVIAGGFGSSVEMTSKAKLWLNKRLKDDGCQLLITPSGDLLKEETGGRKSVSLSFATNPATSSSSVMVSSKPLSLRAGSSSLSSSAPAAAQSGSAVTAPPPAPQIDERTARLQTDLYVKLIKIRNSLSSETGFTPHNIASNKVLLDMAKFRPSTRTSLLKLEDFSEIKIDRFGDKFLEFINSFCDENSLKKDDFPDIPDTNVDSDGATRDDIMKITETQRASYIMYALQKQSLEEVASRRGLKVSTVISHLCEALKVGLSVDVRQLGVTDKLEDLITKAIRAPPVNSGISSLTRIKDQLPNYVEYNHIKLVIAMLVQKHGQEVNNNGDMIVGGGVTSHSELVSVDDIFDDENPGNKTVTCKSPCLKRQRTASPPVSPPLSRSSSLNLNLSSSLSQKPVTKRAASDTRSIWTESQAALSQPIHFSPTDSQTATRTIPSWMAAAANKTVFKKKMKSKSLFK